MKEVCEIPVLLSFWGLSQRGPVDKLKKDGLLYGILIISSMQEVTFYDGNPKRTNPDGNP